MATKLIKAGFLGICFLNTFGTKSWDLPSAHQLANCTATSAAIT